MNSFKYIALICSVSVLTGCKTPVEKQVAHIHTSNGFQPEIQFVLEKSFKPNEIRCIAVGTIVDLSNATQFKSLNKSQLVRRAVYGVLSTKNYIDIELSRVDHILSNPAEDMLGKLKCDAKLTGQIIKFQNTSLISYSVTTVELNLELTDKKGKTLWQGQHAANSRDGTLPLSPLSLVSGVLVASLNREDEVALQMVDSAARRILNTLPDRSELDIVAAFAADFDSDKPENLKVPSQAQSSAQLLAQGKYEEALITAEQEAEKAPHDEKPLIIASRASLLLGNYDSANDYAMKAVVKNESNREGLTALGASFIKLKKLKLAEGTFVKLVRSENSKPYDWFHLALVQQAQNNFSSAADNLLIAGEIGLSQKDYETAYKSLAKLKSISGTSLKANKNYQDLGLQVSNFLKIKNNGT